MLSARITERRDAATEARTIVVFFSLGRVVATSMESEQSGISGATYGSWENIVSKFFAVPRIVEIGTSALPIAPGSLPPID